MDLSSTVDCSSFRKFRYMCFAQVRVCMHRGGEFEQYRVSYVSWARKKHSLFQWPALEYCVPGNSDEPPTRDNSTNLNIAVSMVHHIHRLFDKKGTVDPVSMEKVGLQETSSTQCCILYSVGVILEKPLMCPKWCSCKVLNNTHVQVLGPKTFQSPFGRLSPVSSKL